MSYPDIETKYLIETIDLRHQSYHITPRKIQPFQQYDANPDNARLYVILIRRRDTELISNGNESIEIKVI